MYVLRVYTDKKVQIRDTKKPLGAAQRRRERETEKERKKKVDLWGDSSICTSTYILAST